MSAKSWLEEFYPTPANETKPGRRAIEHSLQKWRGLTKENLECHGIAVVRTRPWPSLHDKSGEAFFSPSNGNCSLCNHYLSGTLYEENGHWCGACPLYKVRKRACDEDGRYMSPWHKWTEQLDPKPMIKLLERAAKKYAEEEAAK